MLGLNRAMQSFPTKPERKENLIVFAFGMNPQIKPGLPGSLTYSRTGPNAKQARVNFWV